MVMNNNLPPSARRQNWKAIASMAGIAFTISFLTLIYQTWHIGTKWGRFSDHWISLQAALKDFVFKHQLNGWNNYWQIITDYSFEYHFIAHVGLPLIVALAIAFMTGKLFYYPGGRDYLRHMSGSQLYLHCVGVKHAKSQLVNEQRSHPKLGLKIHSDIAIPRNRESGNLLIGGVQGGGKTVVITPLIEQVINRGERVFIYDEKREFTALFFNPTTCILIAPWDERGQAWDISADAKNATNAQLITERLIPDSNDPLWSNGARMIVTGMIEILNHTKQRWGWSELADILSLDEVTLNKLLTLYYPRAARFIAENSKTTHSFFAQLLGSLGWIFSLSSAWPNAYENGFSITKWVNQRNPEKPTIIVQADKRFKDIGAPLANAMISLMTSTVLAQTNTTQRELWLFLDELGNLPRNGSLIEWMSLGRSKGCRLVAGTQSISQLKEIYTDKGADSLLNLFSIIISLRVGAAGDSANYVAKIFGEREVERPTNTTGLHGSHVTNWQRESLPLVTPSDLVHLPQVDHRGAEGYLLVPGWKAVYRLRWPLPKFPKIALEHCPALWLQTFQSKLISNKNSEPTSTIRLEQLRQRRSHAVNECD
jgi:succinate dehydrogenase hydrophobic anchor subunit